MGSSSQPTLQPVQAPPIPAPSAPAIDAVAFAPEPAATAGWTLSEARPLQRKRAGSAGTTGDAGWSLGERRPLGGRAPSTPWQVAPATVLQARKDPGSAGADQVPTAGGGRALPEGVRTGMESALGHDFSGVRVHEDGQAASVGAMAFTRGQDVHFAPGKLDTQSRSGLSLLGHELAHVAQQADGRVAANTQAKGLPVNDQPELEAEADRLGDRAASAVMSGERAEGPISSARAEGAAPVQRKVGDVIQKAGDKPPFTRAAFEEFLQGQATAAGKNGLYQFYQQLGDAGKGIALTQLLGAGYEGKTLDDAKSACTGWLGRKVEWDKFSVAIRFAANQVQIATPSANGAADYVATGGGLTSAAAAGPGVAMNALGAMGTVGAATGQLAEGLNVLSAVSPGIGILGSAGSAIAAAQQYNTNSTEGQFNATHTAVLANTVDAGRQAATTAHGAITNLGAAGSAAAALTATGALSVAAGGYNLINGVVGGVNAHERMGALQGIAGRTQDARVGAAAAHAASTQGINRTVSAATAVKGAAMIVGGALLLASNPVGWMILGAGAVVGGIAAFWAWRKRARRKVDVVDRELKLDQVPESERERRRDEKLQSMGFNTHEQFYEAYVYTTAAYLHQAGVMGGDRDAIGVIENIGLQVKPRQKPEIAEIARLLESQL